MHKMTNVPNYQELRELVPELKYVLWDMDGTIMETEKFHINSTLEILKELSPESKLTLKEIERFCIGTTDHKILSQIQETGALLKISPHDFIEKKNIVIENYLKEIKNKEIFNPKVGTLIQTLNESGIRQSVVTSSERSVTKTLLAHLKLTEFFSFIITREDTKLNKPDPEPYLLAMKRFETTADKCLIFEDSQSGLTAARKSRAKYINAAWYTLP